MSDVTREKSGMAAGLTSTMRYFGGVTGLGVLGLVLTDNPAPDVVMRQHTTAVLIYCGALVLSLGCALALPRRATEIEPAKASRA